MAIAVALAVFALVKPDGAASAVSVTSGLWGADASPANPDSDDAQSVELGLRFTSSVAGTVTGVRFYKGSRNTGLHTGTLWSASGSWLATATFQGETASGWQSALFSRPVSVVKNTEYVVSYHTATGHYAEDEGQFASPIIRGPLTAFAGRNGVYRYAGASAFPTDTYHQTNYWVDPLFVTGTTPTPSTTTAPTPTTTVPTTTTTTASTTPKTTAPTTTKTTAPTTTTATTASSQCSTSQVWQNLDSCGWPGPAATGYPTGQVFAKTIAGELTITGDGTVIDGYKVSGGIQVRAKNVVIRNSWVTSNFGGNDGSGVINLNPGSSATIDHSFLDGSNATHACIWDEGSSMVATFNECTGTNDGIFSWATQTGVDGTGDNFRIENNWLHNFTTLASNGHVDGYQTEGAKHGVIRHNVVDVSQDQNAAISIWNGRKSSDDILVDSNLLAGGGFTAYAEDYSPSETNPAGGYTVTNISFTNNRFSTVHFGCVGYWGAWFPRGAPSDGWRRSGNVVLETGQKIDSSNPTNQGAPCN